MSRPVVVLSGLLLFSSLCFAQAAQQQPSAPPPAQAQTPSEGGPAPQQTPNSSSSSTPPSAANKADDFSTQQAVVKRHDTIYRFEADGTGTRNETVAILVQSEAGVQQLGQLQLGYNSGDQDLKINYVRVRKPDGSVIEADLKTAVQDMTGPVARVAPMYTDYREKHVTVPALRPGDTLEYQTIINTTKALAPNQFWMQHDFDDQLIVLDEHLTVDVPAAKKVYLKTDADSKNYETKEANGRRVYNWAYKNNKTRMQKYLEEREASPSKRPKRPKQDDQVSVELTTFANWEELSKWYSGLERERRLPNDAMRAKVAELTKDKKTDREKVQAVYDYVAKNYRYISLSFGIGRYQPHAAPEVFTNEYGDCKDKHTLLASMLSVLGYKMNTVLIGSQHKLDVDIASPSQFDHVIGNLKLGNDVIWMDTTSEIAPIGLLVPQIRNKQALQIAPDAASAIVTTPAGAPFSQEVTYKLDGKVTELGRLEATVTRTMRGDQELAMRAALRRVPQSSWDELLNYIVGQEMPGAKAADLTVSTLEDTSQPLKISYTESMSNFIDYTAKETKFALPFEPLNVPTVDPEDTESAKLYGPVTMTYDMTVKVPESIKIDPPIPVEVKRDYATYSTTAAFQDHTFSASRKMVITAFEVPPTRSGDLKSFARVIASDNSQFARVTNSNAGTTAAASISKPEEIEEAAYNALQARKFKLAAELYQRLTEKDPKHPRAWNNLGRAYMAQMQLDKSIAAFNKALEVNAYDEYAYNNLGAAYELAQKYNEAKDAYRKQLEMNPLDEYAHSNLGRLMLRDHEYDGAVKEFERASGLKPDDGVVLQQLGEAYLAVNQTDKAMSTFDKALEKSPTPLMWNNVAYVLAKYKQRLDTALEYAQSAVSTTETQLKNLSPEQAEWQGRGVSASLASYWDTLGWVYFQRGDNQQAEKFLMAAWQHAEHGEVADHLGQLYEKLGNKQQAIDFYARALAAPESVPETRDRLSKLIGPKQSVDKLVTAAKTELERARTVKANWPNTAGNAEVLLTFGAKGAVQNVKFLSGEKQFSSKIDDLKRLNYPLAYPDSTQGFVHKANVQCTNGACAVIVIPADARNMGVTADEAADVAPEGN